MSTIRTLGEFAFHMFAGAFLFGLVAFIAIGMDYSLNQIFDLANGTPDFVRETIKHMKYVLFTADVLLFALFTLRTSYNFATSIWR